MSSPKRRRRALPLPRDGGHQLMPNSDPPFIPADLIVEILAHSDTKTIVRGAATCKPIRRAIAAPDFLRRVALAPRAGAGGGFDPDLLLGASCVFEYGGHPRDIFFQEQRRPFSFKFKAGELSLYEPMVTRGCLAVLHRRGQLSAAVRVVNCLTGHVTRVDSPGTAALYPRTLLAVGDGGRSFKLLVADKDLATRIFSSEHGRWGDVVHTRLDPPAPGFLSTLPNRLSPPCVIGDNTIHWLCKEKGIVALDVGATRATVIELPPKCFAQVSCPKGMDKGLLASTADGRLSLLVAEAQVISMWTLSSSSAPTPAASWSRQVVIHREAVVGGMGPGGAVRLVGFGERSGTAMLQMEQVGLVRLDVRSREALLLSDKFKEIGSRPTKYARLLQLCLHETDLTTSIESITKNMKLF